jgi:hypothetical protein
MKVSWFINLEVGLQAKNLLVDARMMEDSLEVLVFYKDSISVWCACDNRTGLNSLGNLFHNQHFRTASGADRMTGEHDDAIA